MKEMTAGVTLDQPRWRKAIVPAVMLLTAILIGFFALYAATARQPVATLPPTLLSQRALEEQYGLRVDLIGITAAGGMVDLHLKVLDAEKSRSLLKDPANFPALRTETGGIVLSASEDSRARSNHLENGRGLHLLFPNVSNTVQPGAAVIVILGGMHLESITAR
jgi:hypothetical protein